MEMVRKFAQLEFRYGSVERGKTLFENMVTTYPRRTDIWSVYIDVCVKFNDINQARSCKSWFILGTERTGFVQILESHGI